MNQPTSPKHCGRCSRLAAQTCPEPPAQPQPPCHLFESWTDWLKREIARAERAQLLIGIAAACLVVMAGLTVLPML